MNLLLAGLALSSAATVAQAQTVYTSDWTYTDPQYNYLAAEAFAWTPYDYGWEFSVQVFGELDTPEGAYLDSDSEQGETGAAISLCAVDQESGSYQFYWDVSYTYNSTTYPVGDWLTFIWMPPSGRRRARFGYRQRIRIGA